MEFAREDIAATLAARRYLYALFQGLFGTEPNSDQAAACTPSLAAEALDIFGVSSEGSAVFLTALEVLSDEPERFIGVYNRLFVGPAALPAPPWESVYAARSDVLFGRGTLEVRRMYRSFGFLPEGYPSVADDHVALELGFMAQLGEKALAAWSEMRDAETARILMASADFLQAHLGWWIALWADRLSSGEECMLYDAAAHCAARFVQRDEVCVQEVLRLVA